MTSALVLLREALDLFNDRPNFSLRRDRDRTSYKLAARIDAHLAARGASEPHPAIAIARARWSDDTDIVIDADETRASDGCDGTWVRAWLLVPKADFPCGTANGPA